MDLWRVKPENGQERGGRSYNDRVRLGVKKIVVGRFFPDGQWLLPKTGHVALPFFSSPQ